MVEAPKEEVHCKGSPLSYAWLKVREHDAFILFDPGSTHNFTSLELATKLGVQDFEMRDAMKADGAFINQEVSVTPLIGKLRLHIQGYVDKEDFFISPLKHEDVILGAPWFDRLAASIKFPERKISFKFREKDMYINAQESSSSIPLVNDQAFDKSIRSSIFVYMIFALNGVDITQVNEKGMQVDLELSNFLNQFQDVFIDDIPGELPPKRGDDDHMIELIPGSSSPNKPPYRVSQAQQEEIMMQVNELVEKGMVHGKIFTADEYSRDLKESFQKIKEAISIAQQKQKAAANKHRRALAFKENDWVLLKFPKARLRHTTGKNPTGHQKYYAKLAKRYYGPFQILNPINEMAYQLKLPNHWLIHNAFHVSLLEPYKGEPPKEAIMEDPPEVEGQEEVLQPESVLQHEDKVLRNGKIIRRYLIKFKNYPFADAKWMQGTQLKDSLHLVNAYNASLEWQDMIPMSQVEGCPPVYQVIWSVSPGYHQFKFMVDGEWRHDDQQPSVTDSAGNCSNCILVREFESGSGPGGSVLGGSMDVEDGEMNIARVGMTSFSRPHEIPLEGMQNISVADVDASRHRIDNFLTSHSAYEVLPDSGKVVALDISLPIKQAFHVLYEQGIPLAPLWDSDQQQFVGMLTASDFIAILMQLELQVCSFHRSLVDGPQDSRVLHS
ncbi:hypothetical protein L7F22_016844 [Adiantum nelumboides]|nr:hypothetical protein [Adiantum nelumboides]